MPDPGTQISLTHRVSPKARYRGRIAGMKLPDTPFARRLGGLITRWTYRPEKGTTGYRYFGTCVGDSCGKEISLYKYNVRQDGNMRCRLCSKLKGYILDVPVYNARLWAAADRISEMRHDGKYWRAYVKCKVENCRGTVLFRNAQYRHVGKPNFGLCRSHIKQRLRLRPYESRYNGFVRTAASRGWEVTITYLGYVRILSKNKCHYCDAVLNRKTHNIYGEKLLGAGHIDRKDPRKGYVRGNCVPCCPPCNFAKNVYFTYEEMLVVGAIRQGDVIKACKIAKQLNTVKNAKTVQAIYDRVWKDRKGRAAVWKRPAKQPKSLRRD